VAGHGAQGRGAIALGDPAQLVGGVACRRHIADRQQDLDLSVQQLGPPEPLGGHGDDPADRRRGRVGPALSQPQQGQPWLRLQAPAAGLPVGVLRRREVPQGPVELRLLVEGGAGGIAVGTLRESLSCPSSLLGRLRPGPVQVQDLGPVNQALAGEGDQVRLLVAPGRQRGSPFVGAAPLQDLLAGIDHRAVHRPGDGGRQLAGHDRHHRLVQQHQALTHPGRSHRGAALDAQRERDQVTIGNAPADRDGTGRCLARAHRITGHRLPQGDRQQEIAVLGALLLVLQEAVGAGEPATGLRQLPLVDQVKGQPESAPRGPPPIAALGVELLGALQRPQAVLDLAEEIGGGRQQLQILPCQGGRSVGQRQRGIGLGPRPPPSSLAPPHQLSTTAHRALTSPAGAGSDLGSVASPVAEAHRRSWPQTMRSGRGDDTRRAP
jgi:hypothetical protein